MPEELVGIVNDFFARPVVAGVELNGTLRLGDKIKISGHTSQLELMVDSLQINRVSVNQAGPGDSVGIKVPDRVRKGDMVFRVV